jgi:phosphonate transport system substrate-binding protein
MHEGVDYRTLRFNSDLGKHGDTGTSGVDVVGAALDGRADGGAIGSPFWKTVQSERLVRGRALREVWSSPEYNHCMFTARTDLDSERERRFAHAFAAMSYDNPVHRPILEAEGLQRWLPPHASVAAQKDVPGHTFVIQALWALCQLISETVLQHGRYRCSLKLAFVSYSAGSQIPD